MELLPTGTVGESDHEVIVTGIDVGRNLNVDSCIVLALTGRNCVVAVINPGVLRLFLRIHGAFRSSGAVGVMVEVVVNLDVVVAKFLIVGHDIVEGDDVAAVVLLTINGIGNDTLIADDGLLHVLLRLVIAAAARTECAQQHDGIDNVLFHIVYLLIRDGDARARHPRHPPRR